LAFHLPTTGARAPPLLLLHGTHYHPVLFSQAFFLDEGVDHF
ncbi:MAG: hypothetical protein JWR85_3540, partial [Marmoricola sp.]|nr:hypothetical protein [Marmoricola sp.]